MTEAELKDEHGDSRGEQRDKIGYEERTSAVVVGNVGEPPDVPESDSRSYCSHDERESGFPEFYDRNPPSIVVNYYLCL